MPILTPGYFPGNIFLDGYWQDDYWADYGTHVDAFEESMYLKSYINMTISKYSELDSDISILRYSEIN